MTPSIPRIEYEKYVLDNGLQVILHIDRKLPVVHVNHWFHVGSKDEKPGRTGFAHLFEHIMFEGSKHAPEGYFPYVERAGANLREGGVNGTTGYDRTNYFATVPSGNLEYLLWLESDRIATLADALTQERLDNQRDVVRNERRQSYENQPYGRAFLLIPEHLHPPGHPYSWPVIGSHEDLEAATLEDVRAFFRTFYTPNNLSLVIAGDFDPDEAGRLVEKYYGGIPSGPALSRAARWVPQLRGEKILDIKDRVPQERVYMLWPAPPRFDPDEARLDLAASVCSDGLSSRLKRLLVYDRRLCTEVMAFDWSSEIAGIFGVIATARPDAALAEIEQTVTDELARLAGEGPTGAELDRAKTRWEHQFVSGLERIGGFGGKADRLNESNVYLGNPGYFMEEFEHFARVDAEAVRAAADGWLNHRNRLLIRFHPEAAHRPAGRALDRSKPPPLGVDRRFYPSDVKSHTLDNGLTVFAVERADLPKITVHFTTAAGSVLDPAGKEGLAHLMLTTLDKGTRTRTALALAEAFADLGTALQAAVYHESSSIAFDVLKRHIEPALGLLSDVLFNPAFPEAEFDREAKRHLDALSQHENTPTALAARVGPMLLFGRAHPYGRPARGLPASVQALSREDLAQWYDAHWSRANAALIIAGDITMDEAVGLAQRHLAGWPAKAAGSPDIPAPQPGRSDAVYLIDRPGAPQTVVWYMLPAPPRRTPDYYALRLVDVIWGGSFGSRLNLNLREEKGYTYGVSSAIAMHGAHGIWWAQSAVQTDKTGDTLRELAAELRGLAGERPITAQELDQARVNRLRGYAQQFESLRRVAGQVADLWTANLPMSEFQEAIDKVERLTLDEVNAAAQKYAVPDRAVTLLVGDRASIEAQIQGIGEVIPVDVTGQT